MKVRGDKRLTVRENETKERFRKYREITELLSKFFEKGFRSYQALKAIVNLYYPDMDKQKLKAIWNYRTIDEEVKLQLEDVFEKLSRE